MEVVAAVVGVADVTARSAHMLWRLCDAWRDAPHEVFQLRDDLSRANEFYASLKQDLTTYVKSSGSPSMEEEAGTACELSDWHSCFSDPSTAGPRPLKSPPITEPPPPWSPPDAEPSAGLASYCNPSATARYKMPGKLRTLLELITTGGKVVHGLESIIGQVFRGRAEQPGDWQRGPSQRSELSMGSRRKMVWLVKASAVRKLRTEMSTNMQMISSVLVALNASATSNLVKSVAVLTHQEGSHHEELKATVLEATGALLTMITTSSTEIRRKFAELEEQLAGLPASDSPTKLHPHEAHGPAIPAAKSTMPFLSCKWSCACQCHDSTSLTTSWILDSLQTTIGCLRISTVKRQLCNRRKCTQYRKSDSQYTIMYRIPAWLAPMCVRLYYSSSAQRGFSLNLRVSRQRDGQATFDQSNIFYYVFHNNLNGLKQILGEQPAAVTDVMGRNSQTPLHVALIQGLVDVALLLLQAGADPFYRNSEGTSPWDMIQNKWLAKHPTGCKLMETDLVQRQYYEYLEWAGFSDLEQVIIGAKPMDVATALTIPLLVSQARVTSTGRTSPLRLAVNKGDVEWVDALIQLGADVDEQGSNGYPILMVAATSGHLDIMRLLLEGGADVNQRSDVDHTTALFWSVDERRRANKNAVDAVQMLLDYGAEVDLPEKWDGYTALLMCSFCGSAPEIVRRLIRHGADMDRVTPRSIFCQSPGNCLTEAIQYDRGEILDVLLDEGADWRYTLPDGKGILHELAATGCAEMIRRVRSRKIRGLPTKLRDEVGKTPLDILEGRANLFDDIREEFLRLLDEQEPADKDADVDVEGSTDSDDEVFHDVYATLVFNRD